jgi:hypothetical protein
MTVRHVVITRRVAAPSFHDDIAGLSGENKRAGLSDTARRNLGANHVRTLSAAGSGARQMAAGFLPA